MNAKLNTNSKVNLVATLKKEEKIKNLTEIATKIECAKRAGKAYRLEQSGLNTFCRTLLESDNIDIRETLKGFNLVDKDSIFKFIKENSIYISNAGTICKRVSTESNEVKKYVEVTRWGYHLLLQSIVGNLKGRASKVVDLEKYYTAKGVELAQHDAQKLINDAKAAAAQQQALQSKIDSQKEKLYNEYLTSISIAKE